MPYCGLFHPATVNPWLIHTFGTPIHLFQDFRSTDSDETNSSVTTHKEYPSSQVLPPCRQGRNHHCSRTCYHPLEHHPPHFQIAPRHQQRLIRTLFSNWPSCHPRDQTGVSIASREQTDSRAQHPEFERSLLAITMHTHMHSELHTYITCSNPKPKESNMYQRRK
jgi:hypothetical protein